MNEPELMETKHSVVFLVPKPPFFEWLDQVLQNRGLIMKDIYFEEEDMVCLIPSIGSLGSNEKLNTYLDQLKKQLLVKTFGAFATNWEECPEINPRTFDSFFELKMRDKVWTAKQ